MSSNAVVPNNAMLIAKTTFQYSFKTLELAHHDMILGCDWFALVSPISFNIPKQQFSFTPDGNKIISTPICTGSIAPVEIQAE